jgi:hypothetical protein
MPSKTAQKASKTPSKHGSKPAKKKRLPKDFSRQISEHEIHLHAWQWVKKTYPHLLIFHVPSGEHRNVVTAVKLKRMGVIPGVADFLIFVTGYSIAIELKDKGGVQSEAQKRFQSCWEGLGHRYKIARSLEQFQNIVNEYVNLAWPWLNNQNP